MNPWRRRGAGPEAALARAPTRTCSEPRAPGGLPPDQDTRAQGTPGDPGHVQPESPPSPLPALAFGEGEKGLKSCNTTGRVTEHGAW